MTKKKVFIATDSRGRDLQPFLASHFSQQQLSIQVDVCPGATLEQLVNVIKAKTDDSHDLIILSGGICNLTTKTKGKGIKSLTYHRNEDNISKIKDLVTTTQGTFGNRLSIATIPPASLLKFFQYHNKSLDPPEYLTEQQRDLLQDTEEVNQYITTLSKAANIRTIDLHKQVFNNVLDPKKKNKHSCEKRRRVFLEKLLTDGVHANTTLKQKWFKRYAQSIGDWLSHASSSDTETDGGEAWDYKRHDPKPSTSRQ